MLVLMTTRTKGHLFRLMFTKTARQYVLNVHLTWPFPSLTLMVKVGLRKGQVCWPGLPPNESSLKIEDKYVRMPCTNKDVGEQNDTYLASIVHQKNCPSASQRHKDACLANTLPPSLRGSTQRCPTSLPCPCPKSKHSGSTYYFLRLGIQHPNKVQYCFVNQAEN